MIVFAMIPNGELFMLEDKFIGRKIETIYDSEGAIVGGLCVEVAHPHPEKIGRWKYTHRPEVKLIYPFTRVRRMMFRQRDTETKPLANTKAG